MKVDRRCVDGIYQNEVRCLSVFYVGFVILFHSIRADFILF